MFDLLLFLKELLSSAAIIFCIVTFCISLRSDHTMLEAAKIIWNFLSECLIEYVDKKKEQKFFKYSTEVAKEIETNVKTVVGDTRYAELCKLAQSAIAEPLILMCRRLGMTCIKVSVYYADDNEKQRLESLLTNVVENYLRITHFDTRILSEWTMRPDLAMPVLLMHFALTKEQQKALNKELASRNAKIAAKNTAVIDDTEEVELY